MARRACIRSRATNCELCVVYNASSLSAGMSSRRSGVAQLLKSFHTLIMRLGERASMPFPIHPHMLRHGCGYALANAGNDTQSIQAWMGHKNIQHTVRYTELAPDRFKGFWRD